MRLGQSQQRQHGEQTIINNNASNESFSIHENECTDGKKTSCQSLRHNVAHMKRGVWVCKWVPGKAAPNFAGLNGDHMRQS